MTRRWAGFPTTWADFRRSCSLPRTSSSSAAPRRCGAAGSTSPFPLWMPNTSGPSRPTRGPSRKGTASCAGAIRASGTRLPPSTGRLAPVGGDRIIALRTERVAELAAEMSRAYALLCGGSEGATLDYVSTLAGIGPEGILALLEAGRVRDLQAGTTLTGPHRDDLRFGVAGADAGDFASEGQQRSAMLALGSLAPRRPGFIGAAACGRSSLRTMSSANSIPAGGRAFGRRLTASRRLSPRGPRGPTPTSGNGRCSRLRAGHFRRSLGPWGNPVEFSRVGVVPGDPRRAPGRHFKDGDNGAQPPFRRPVCGHHAGKAVRGGRPAAPHHGGCRGRAPL